MKTIAFQILLGFILFPLILVGQSTNWVRQIGGVFADNTIGLSVDPQLNIYSVTNFSSTISITTGQNFSSFGKEDFLLTKMSPGGILLWARKFGGRQTDFAHNVTNDVDGNVYVTGTFQDTLLLFDQLLLTTPVSGANTGFVLKLGTNGDVLWAAGFRTTNNSYPIKAVGLPGGDVVVTGHFEGTTDFDPGIAQNNLTSTGELDAFFLKLNSSGQFVWARKIGGTESEMINDCVVDNSGSVISTGLFNQVVDFDPGSGESYTPHAGQSDIFLHKLSADGNFMWAYAFGGVGFDAGLGIDLSQNQDIILAGRFSNTVDFNPIPDQTNNLVSEGSWDGFILRANNNGQFIWAKRIGSNQNDQCMSVDVGLNDIICVGGVYRSTVNFNPDFFPNQFSTASGGSDVFQLILNSNGSYNSHYTFGGLGNDVLNKIVLYSLNNIISVGNFSGIVDFDPSPNTNNFTSLGNTDGFICNVFNCIRPFIPNITATSQNVCAGESFTISIPGAQLNGANQWSWYRNFCNNSSFATGNSITGTVPTNTVFYVRGTGGCVQTTSCRDILISIFTDTLTNQTLSICQGDSVVVGNNVYRTSGLYRDTLTASVGCDSIIFTNLQVSPNFTRNQSFTICPGEEIMVGTNIYRSNGTYIDTLTSSLGCDSIVTTVINVIPVEIISQDISICQGEVYQVQDSVYSETGTYINSIFTPEGCENFAITNLTVHPLEYNITHNLCFGDTLQIGNMQYTTSLIVVEFLGSSIGCDSIVNHTINFFDTSFEFNDIFLCEGDSVIVGNNVYKESGLYTDSLFNIAGCDSIIQSNIVFFDKPDPQEFNFVICEGQSILVNGTTYFAPGTYMDTIQTSTGCDSIITVHLTVYPNFTQNLITICEGDSLVFGNRILKTQGVYSQLFTSSLGCDSSSTVILSVINKINEFYSFDICEGESINIGQSSYNLSGTYLDTLVSARGCDSIIQTTIRVRPSVFQRFYSVCEGEKIIIGSNVYEESGIFTDSLISSVGCDSIIISNIVVNPKDSVNQSFTICKGKTVRVGNNVYSESGIYFDSFNNQFDCDSIVRTELLVLPVPEVDLDSTICSGTMIQLGNFTFSNSGMFEVYVSGNNSCDTLVNLNLTVLLADVDVKRTGNVLSVSETQGATYQWYSCENEKTIIPGAVLPVFIPQNNGKYVLDVTLEGCVFSSECTDFIKTSVGDTDKSYYRVFPNPFSQELFLNGANFPAEVVIYRNDGSLMYKTNHSKPEVAIRLPEMMSGLYYIKVTNSMHTQIIPVVKM